MSLKVLNYLASLVDHGLLVINMYIKGKPLTALAEKLEVPDVPTPVMLLRLVSHTRQDLHVIAGPDVMAVLILPEPTMGGLPVLGVPAHDPVLNAHNFPDIVPLAIVVALRLEVEN